MIRMRFIFVHESFNNIFNRANDEMNFDIKEDKKLNKINSKIDIYLFLERLYISSTLRKQKTLNSNKRKTSQRAKY